MSSFVFNPLTNNLDIAPGAADVAAAQAAVIDAQNAAVAAQDAANSAVAAQSAGFIGFATKATMDASLNYAANTMCVVTNDPILENNRYYHKLGASGSGSWVLSEDIVSLASGLLDGRSVYRPDRAISLQDAVGGEIGYLDGEGALHMANLNLYAGGVNVGTSAAQVVADENYNASQYATVFVDAQMGLLGGFDTQGYFRCGPYRLRVDDQFPPIANFTKATIGYKAVACWGDSLTARTYPDILRTLTGLHIFKGGMSGASAGMIAGFSGGAAPIVSLQNNTIPASGSVETTYCPVPLRFGDVYNTGAGTIMSGSDAIHGSWSYVRQSSVPNQFVVAFTRTTPGDAVVIDSKVPFIVDQVQATDFSGTVTDGLENDHKINVIWAGRNNGWSTQEQMDETVAYIEKMVAFLKPVYKRFVVLGILNGEAEPLGTSGHTNIVALNDRLKSLYPGNFLDIRQHLVRAYDPNNPTDVQNHADDVPPSSLREDPLHISPAGCQVVAQAVSNFLTLKGWL